MHFQLRLRGPLLMTRRTTFVLIMAFGVATGLVFGLYPQLDLQIASLFYDPARRTWPANESALLAHYRDASSVLAVILVIFAVGALALGAIRRRASALIGPRAAAVLLGSLLIGPGLITNVLLKPQWGRPRPAEVTEFGGHLGFVPWWNPYGACDGNCSFVSGEESVAAWLIAWAVVLPERDRAAAMAIALLHCAAMGLARVAMGGHFTSDVLFAVIFTALGIWVSYSIAFRAPQAVPGPYRRGAAITPS
jgi:membrane-associated PAP2 superfamily phosphatase